AVELCGASGTGTAASGRPGVGGLEQPRARELVEVVRAERAADSYRGRGLVAADEPAGRRDELVQPPPRRVDEGAERIEVVQVGSAPESHACSLTPIKFDETGFMALGLCKSKLSIEGDVNDEHNPRSSVDPARCPTSCRRRRGALA